MNEANIMRLVEDLVPYVKQAWKQTDEYLDKKRKELGHRFNYRNNFALTKEKFGGYCSPEDCKKYILEYILILEKKSKLSSSIRTVIKFIGDKAVERYRVDRLLEKFKPSEGEVEHNEK